jgi:homopolymeric O-antigen transport system ATP-binding protein
MANGFEFHGVSKRYAIGSSRGSLRDAIAAIPRALVGASHRGNPQQIWAVRDVSLGAGKGDVIGLVGSNGAGKTTLLKLLSGITQPTSGSVEVEGRVSSLIELGAGFHPDLTGRENIYLNGVILGLSRRDVSERFQSIVDFAELERFIDTPVKRYSSGMYARLGFAVAAHTDPDVLVVDEVLGVGDQAFQQKCFDFIHAFVAGSKTALFVSHNLFVVEQLCNWLVWLEDGQVVMSGTPNRVLPRYFDAIEQRALRSSSTTANNEVELRVVETTLTDEGGNHRDAFSSGETIAVRLRYEAPEPVQRPHFCLAVTPVGAGHRLFNASMLADGAAPESVSGEGVLKCLFENVPLMPRAYEVWGEVWSADRTRAIVRWQHLASFRILDNGQVEGMSGGIRHVRADGAIRVPYRWEFLDARQQ